MNNRLGPRRNMNGAGAGGRLVARRTRNGIVAGKSQLGSRAQKYRDLRAAFGLDAAYRRSRRARGLSAG